ncbi:MAG: hypothetical protein JWO39_2298, partial [Gemmatimonadetes bacterium]|nr:hypothetical protein [Gemmatimonadota bacterium]
MNRPTASLLTVAFSVALLVIP